MTKHKRVKFHQRNDCATVVEHPVWGKGKPVHGSHAIPDDEGNVEWYDVQFKHGIEEKVMAEDMKIVVSEAHHEEKMPKTKAEMINAMNDMMKKMKKDEMKTMYAQVMNGQDDEEVCQQKKIQSKMAWSISCRWRKLETLSIWTTIVKVQMYSCLHR